MNLEEVFILDQYESTYIQCIVTWELQRLREQRLGLYVYF